MKILVMFLTGRGFFMECESTDTIGNLKVKVDDLVDFPPDQQRVLFDGKQLEDNITLAYYGIQQGSLLLIIHRLCGGASGIIERPRRSKVGDLIYGDPSESVWTAEHGKELLHLLLKLCQDGTISEGNITEAAWLRIENGLKSSTKCSFQIDYLKERLRDYKQLYSLLAETSSSIYLWDREKKTVLIKSKCQEHSRELLLCSGAYIPYLDILEEVCVLLNTGRSSEQQVPEGP